MVVVVVVTVVIVPAFCLESLLACRAYLTRLARLDCAEGPKFVPDRIEDKDACSLLSVNKFASSASVC